MNDYLYYILIGLVIFLVIIIFLMHRKNQQSTPPAAAPLPEQPKAIEEVEEQASIPPEKPSEGRLEVAKNYIEQKRYDDAATLLTEGLTVEPHNDNYKLQLLNVYAQAGQHDEFNNLYQSIQTQADMLTLQQAKEIKQQYTERFPQQMAETQLSPATEDLNSQQHTNNDNLAAIEDDLAFEFENEELSFDDAISSEEEKSSDGELSFATEDGDTEALSLTSETPASLETHEDTLSTNNKNEVEADEDIFNFDELEEQLLTPETQSDVETETNLDIENSLENNSLEIETAGTELDTEFNLDEDFGEDLLTEQTPVDKSNNDLNLESAKDEFITDKSVDDSVDDNELSFDDDDLLKLSTEEEVDNTANQTHKEESEPTFDFDLDLADEVSESPQANTAHPVEQDLVSDDDDSIDFFDDIDLEETADQPASNTETAPVIDEDETEESFEFEIDDLDEVNADTANIAELETTQESPQLQDSDEFDFDLTEAEQSSSDNKDAKDENDEVILDLEESLEEGTVEQTPSVSQPPVQETNSTLPESIITETVEDAKVTDESTIDDTEEELVFDFESESNTESPATESEQPTVTKSEPVVDEKLSQETQITAQNAITPVTTTKEEIISEDEDLIFNEGVADTISQLDALDFDFDAQYEDDFEQSSAVEQPTKSTTDTSGSLDLLDSTTPVTTTPEQRVADKVSPQQPTQTDALTTQTPAAPVTKIDKEFGQAFDFVEQLDKSQITLDLAEQYLDLGEYDSAKRLVNEVLTSTTSEQHKAHAQTLLERIH